MMIRLLLILMFATLIKSCPGKKYCRECLKKSDNIWKTCDLSFFDESKKSCSDLVESDDKNCIEFVVSDTKTLCTNCRYGYYLSADHVCISCGVEHCAICNPDLKCTACFLGLQIEKSICDAKNKCQKNPNCEICTTNEVPSEWICKLCILGFALNKNHECVASAANCELAQENEVKLCDKCRQGFYLTKDYFCVKNEAENKSKGKWFFVLLVLIGAIVAALFWFRTQKRQNRNQRGDNEGYVTVG